MILNDKEHQAIKDFVNRYGKSKLAEVAEVSINTVSNVLSVGECSANSFEKIVQGMVKHEKRINQLTKSL